MRKRWIGFAVWLLLAACLYFFENNTWTRAVFLCSLLFPLIPSLRKAFFTGDDISRKDAGGKQTVRAFIQGEAEGPGDARLYQPGDPVRRIHWKLSAKKGDLLVLDAAAEQETAEAEQAAPSDAGGSKKTGRGPFILITAGLMALCVSLATLVPEARHGIQALCNRLFAASEAVNAYAYDYFPVAEGQSVTLAVILIAVSLLALITLMILLRSRTMGLGIMAAITLCQVYFGLPLPAWAGFFLYGSLALWMVRRPLSPRGAPAFVTVLLGAALLVMFLFPGVDAATEAASEKARDHLSRMAQQITGAVRELPEGETETRHTHTQTLQAGGREAQTGREYRLVTVEKEMISMPRIINWLKTILLFLSLIAVVILPFAPFFLLNARKKKALEARKAFASDNISEAVCAIFRQVITWLDETGHDAGNLPYREWTEMLPKDMPDGYADRFGACAEDFEEAAYSSHDLPEEKRRMALSLLKETETALFRTADWKQRLRIRYWLCLCE